MLYTFPYDSTNYSPAMPIVEIGIRSTDRAARQKIVIRALLDSGSDATMIPSRHIRAIRARYVRNANIVTITGDRTPVTTYRVALRIGQILIPGVQVIADRHNGEAILGRDVLNQLIVTLNGLVGVAEISD